MFLYAPNSISSSSMPFFPSLFKYNLWGRSKAADVTNPGPDICCNQSAICEALVCALLGCGWVAEEIKRHYEGAVCKERPYIMRLCVIHERKGACRHNSGAVCQPLMSERSKHKLKEFKGTECLTASSLHLHPTWWTAFPAYSWVGGDSGEEGPQHCVAPAVVA